jgi:hypothetical protein
MYIIILCISCFTDQFCGADSFFYKLIVVQLAKTFRAFRRTPRFVRLLTKASQWSTFRYAESNCYIFFYSSCSLTRELAVIFGAQG